MGVQWLPGELTLCLCLLPDHPRRNRSLDAGQAHGDGLRTWLICFGCKPYYSPESPIVPPADGKRKPPLKKPTLKFFCEGWYLLLCCDGLLRSLFPMTANKEGLLKQGLLSSRLHSWPNSEIPKMIPFGLKQCFSQRPPWQLLLKHHPRSPGSWTWPQCWIGRSHLDSGVSCGYG